MSKHWYRTASLISGVVLSIALPAPGRAQIPTEFRNLKVLPADITRDSLIQTMRGFSFATGLRCEDCHVLGENNSFEGARFDLDDKPNKRKARYMIEMVDRLNREVLPGLPGLEGSAMTVECKTCHRGVEQPFLLRTLLRRVIEERGIDAAVARYRQLRANTLEQGAWDFREWEMNELARELAAAGRATDAIAILQLNEEFHAGSASIPAMLGGLFERTDRKEEAIAAYRRAIERNPQDRASQGRLRALTGG